MKGTPSKKHFALVQFIWAVRSAPSSYWRVLVLLFKEDFPQGLGEVGLELFNEVLLSQT